MCFAKPTIQSPLKNCKNEEEINQSSWLPGENASKELCPPRSHSRAGGGGGGVGWVATL